MANEENTQNDGSNTGAENRGNGGQTANDQNSGQQGQPQFVSVEQMNKALSNYNKRLEKQMNDTLTTALGPLQQMLEKIQNPDGNAGNEDANASSGNAQGQQAQQQTTQSNKEILKLQKSLDEMNKKFQAADTERENALKQAVEEKIKSQVLSTLTNLKVEKGEQVFRLIRDNIVVGEDGSVKIKVVDPTLGFEDEKDLKSGITDWLNTDGVHFLPPRNVSGSGATNAKGGTGGGQRITNPNDLMKMKPSELAKVNLKEVFGEEALAAFFNTNQ